MDWQKLQKPTIILTLIMLLKPLSYALTNTSPPFTPPPSTVKESGHAQNAQCVLVRSRLRPSHGCTYLHSHKNLNPLYPNSHYTMAAINDSPQVKSVCVCVHVHVCACMHAHVTNYIANTNESLVNLNHGINHNLVVGQR